jgi:hypothetical protein
MGNLPSHLEEKLDDAEKEAIKKISPLINTSFNFAAKFFADRARFKRTYKNDLDVEKASWQAQIAHPLPHLAIERKASFMADATMGSASRPLFKARPWDNINATRKANAYTKFMQKQQSEMKLCETFYLAYKEMFTVGTAILHTYWDNKIEEIQGEAVPKNVIKKDEYGNPVRDPMTGQVEFEIAMMPGPIETIVRTDRPGIEIVDINDFWIDPAATSLEDARYVIRRKFMAFSELKHFEKLGRLKNVDLLLQTQMPYRSITLNPTGKKGRYENYAEDLNKRVEEYGGTKQGDPICEILEYYEPGKVSIIGNGEVPLDINRPVYRARFPFIRLANLPQLGDFFGLSEYMVCERLFSHINQMQNMIFDNWEKHLKGTTLVGSGVSNLAIEQLKKGEAGDVIKVGDISDIRTERPDIIDGSVVQGMMMLLQECKDALSVDGAISGTSPGSEVRDSQSFEIFTRISQVTLSVTVRRIQDELRELGRQWNGLNKQFLKDKIRIQIAGADGVETLNSPENAVEILDPSNPADIPSNLDVDVQLTTISDVRRDRDLRQMAEAINMAISDPTFRSNEALIQLFSKLDVFEDALDLFETDPEKIMQRATINALASGKKVPVLSGRLGGGGQGQALGQTGGRPGGAEQAQSMQGNQEMQPA